jgi:MFS family permease
LGSRLGINQTRLNTIALAGHRKLMRMCSLDYCSTLLIVGVYITSPIFGRVADKRGPKGLLLVAMIGLLTGYLGIRAFYTASHLGDGDIPTWKLYALVTCALSIGIGSSAGVCASLNTAAKSFPDRSVRQPNCFFSTLIAERFL